MNILNLYQNFSQNQISSSQAYLQIVPEIESFFEKIKLNQIQNSIKKNNPQFLNYTKFIISFHSEKNLTALNYKNYIDLALLYFKDNIYSDERRNLMENIFKFLQPRGKEFFSEALIFFQEMVKPLEKNNIFYVEMAFAYFFAYQLKDFEGIKGILNFHFLKIKENLYENYENIAASINLSPSMPFKLNYLNQKYLCMYYFYQGCYFISLKNFERAAISLTTCVNFHIGNKLKKVYNLFQIESLKRLIFLRFILSEDFGTDILNLIERSLLNNKQILISNAIGIYVNFIEIDFKVIKIFL